MVSKWLLWALMSAAFAALTAILSKLGLRQVNPDDTAILVYRVYYDGFKALDMGGSAAQSAVLMAVVILLTVFQFRFVEKKVQY